ncbi:MAG: DinB family protein [Chloroflexi bacterium]|nr:DinB family protein [Chloroflexota bacterium]
MIRSTSDFIAYLASIRKRTLNYARLVPAARLDWSPQAGEFTCADILRHIAAGERMFVGVVTQNRWKYDGHRGEQKSVEELIAYLEHIHGEAMEALRALPDGELDQMRAPLEGNAQVKAWRWLMAMTEHEIHHRSQLAMYLLLMGITPPHIYGLGVEDLLARATE